MNVPSRQTFIRLIKIDGKKAAFLIIFKCHFSYRTQAVCDLTNNKHAYQATHPRCLIGTLFIRCEFDVVFFVKLMTCHVLIIPLSNHKQYFVVKAYFVCEIQCHRAGDVLCIYPKPGTVIP